MFKIYKKFRQVIIWVSFMMFLASIAMLALMTSLILLQVYCRNFLDLGLPWADELARFAGIALIFLAVPKLLIDNKHIRMDIVLENLSSKNRQFVERILNVLIILFCTIMLFGFYKFLLKAAKFSTPSLGIPNYIFYLPALLGITFLALVALIRLIEQNKVKTELNKVPHS